MKEETARVLRCPFKISNSLLSEKGTILCDGSACMAWIQKQDDQAEGDCGMMAQQRSK